MRGGRWREDRQSVLSRDEFKGSILQRYLTEMRDELDFLKLKSILDEKCNSLSVKTPQDSVIVHMRLGDIMSERKFCKERGLQNIKRYKKFFKKNDCEGFSRVIVVTAMHFGSNKKDNLFMFEDYAVEESYKLLQSFESQVVASGRRFEVVSNQSIDYDLCYMYLAKKFIKGESLLGSIIEVCRAL